MLISVGVQSDQNFNINAELGREGSILTINSQLLVTYCQLERERLTS